MSIGEIFTPRELAIAVWLAVVVVAGLFSLNLRKAAAGVLKALFRLKPLLWIGVVVGYSAGVVALFQAVGIWRFDLLKDTILWLVFTAIASSISEITREGRSNVLKTVALDSLKVMVVVEYLADTYTFSLAAELILQPAVAFVAALDAVANSDDKYRAVQRIRSTVLALFGITVVASSLYKALADSNLFSAGSLRSFLLAPVMSICISPLLIIMIAYAKYESEFTRISIFMKRDRKLAAHTKRMLVRHFGLRTNKLEQFMRMNVAELMNATTSNEIDLLIRGKPVNQP